MKKLLVSLLSLSIFIASLVSATDVKQAGKVYINVNSSSSLSSCVNEESHDKYYYIPSNDNVTIYPDDTYWNSNDAFIRKDSSVEIYRNGVISECDTRQRMSNIVRGGGLSTPKMYPALIFRNDDGCVLNKPNYLKNEGSKATAIDAQIHYTVKFNLIEGGEGSGKAKNKGQFFYNNGEGSYACYPGWERVENTSSCSESSAYYRIEPDKHVGECLNYRVFWCGDGLINRPDGSKNYDNGTYNEECDPNHSEWKNGKNGQTCNPNTCKIEYTSASCGNLDANSPKYNENYPNQRITETSEGLCEVGNIEAGSLKYDSKTGIYTWNCINGNSNRVSCSAQDQWCGDGQINASKEECDPEHQDYKGKGTCNNNCKLEQPLCSSEYNNKKVYQKPEILYLKGTELLCNPGIIQNFWKGGVPLKYTWSCENSTKEPEQCEFNQYWCGDDEVNGGGDRSTFVNGPHFEACDPTAPEWKNRTDGQKCNNECGFDKATCGSKANTTEYNAKFPTGRITISDTGLCGLGKLVEGSFSGPDKNGKYTWKCINGTAESEPCDAQDLWCGDGKKQDNEICDPKDSSHTNWGDGCSLTCEKTYGDAICGSEYNGQTKYQDIRNEWLNKSTKGLCDKGEVIEFSLDRTTGKYTWQCKNGSKVSDICTAKQEWCGDGKYQKDYEQCDPEDSSHTNWGDGCSLTCEKTYGDAICGSEYNGQTKYQDISNERLNENTEGLCDKGRVINFSLNKTTGRYIWQCENGSKVSDICTAKQEWCGDGKKQDNETCDPKDSSHTNWGDGCSLTCEKTYGDAICGSEYNGQTKYQDIRNEWLNKSTKGLCDKGEVVEFSLDRTTGKYTWQCKNGSKVSDICTAKQEWCGDGKYQKDYEQCDYKDPDETNRGNDGCSNSCEKKNQVSDKCDATFHFTLRHGWEYTFYDKFVPGGIRYLYDFSVKFVEKKPYDYNQGENPSFIWMPNLGDGVYKEVSTTGRVIKSTPRYPVIDHPTIEDSGDDDIYIEYDIKYSDKAYPTKPDDSKLKTHKECAYYRISWCGDGILDTDWEGKRPEDKAEECDPGSEGTKVLPDGRICNSDCTIGSAPKTGTLKIEKILQNKKEVTKTGEILIWDVRVRAEGGDVTNFKVEDLVPIALEYKTGKVIKNDDKLTVSGPILLTGTTKLSYEKEANYTGNVYVWDVDGTLKNGHELVLQITTEVVKMPKSQDDYKNVACVIKNEKTIECDDDQPGTRRVVKTLVGSKEVKSTGDFVTWNLKLIVDKGEVKNPVIRDILPPVLGYKNDSYMVINNPGITIFKPTTGTTTTGGQELEEIVWKTDGTVKAGEYVEIQLTTYVKVMPDKEYKNVLCVKPEGEEEKCDPEPIGPNLRIKKYHLNADGTTTKDKKVVKIGDEISYKIMFGNNGTSPATITSIKDFLPKNVEYLTGIIVINRNPDNTTGAKTVDSQRQYGTGGETIDVLNGKKPTSGSIIVDGVHIEIYGGITLNPGDTGYIILTGKVLGKNLDNTINYACIYLNDKKIDCDDVTHVIGSLLCSKEDFKITTTSFSYLGGSTDVSCETSPKGEKADIITIDCGVGSTGTRYYTGENVSSLTGKCTYPGNSNSSPVGYRVQCKVNNVDSNDCIGNVTVNGYTTPSSCFVAGTKVTMADGTEKNIEDVKIGEKIKGEKGVNTVLGYDRPVLGTRHLWSINGGEYFVSDEHPFKTTEGWKSFNPEMTKLEIDLNTTKLKVGDTLVRKDGLELIETVDYINADYNTQLYNFMLDGDNTYYADGYLVHNKGTPICKSISTNPTILVSGTGVDVTCTASDSAYILIDCNYNTGNKYDGANKNKTYFESSGTVRTFTGRCENYQLDTKIQCLVKGSSSTKWENVKAETACGTGVSSSSSSCFVAGTKVTLADGTKKNIEDVKIGDKVLGSNGTINTVLGYDRPALGNRHLWSINGGEYFVSDEHPFKTTEGWKSFNPEMTKLEIDLDTTELKVGDKIITENGEEEIKTVDYITKDSDTQLYNFVLDGDHTYHANGYLVHNKGGGSCFVAGTKVIMADGSEKNIEDVKVGDEILGEGGVNVVLGYDRPILRSRHLWSINGGEYFVSDEHPFKTIEGWKSFNPEMTKLEIDLDTTELKVGDILITKDGLELIEAVDYIDADYNTPLYNFVLDGDHTYYANNYLVHNKDSGTDPENPIIYDPVNCFNVNAGNASIEQGETLPFYWNIEKLSKAVSGGVFSGNSGTGASTGAYSGTVYKTGLFIEYKLGSYPYGKTSNYNNIRSETCTGQEGAIALNSMICSFTITDGKGKVVIEDKPYPCLQAKAKEVSPALVKARANWSRNKYTIGTNGQKKMWTLDTYQDTNYSFRTNVNYIEDFGRKYQDGKDIDTFGEYKISLTKVAYLQCKDGKWEGGKQMPIECQSNFVLTNPYTVQKTPSGNLKASTEVLGKYFVNMDGKSVFNYASEYLQAIASNDSDYAPNKQVENAMKSFITKYEKLAVTVKSESGKTIKKVPGKDIYFVEGEIDPSKITTLNKPVTFVQTKGNTTIRGNIDYNMMLLTNGSITFDGSNSCTTRQVVKGIFYSSLDKNGIIRSSVQKNNNTDNNQWCTEGGLTIKGVIIGNGLKQMMENSRSNLNNWFDESNGGKNANTVMNGASVLIEYSPSVFTKSTMPPGAEDFTTALSIYKN